MSKNNLDTAVNKTELPVRMEDEIVSIENSGLFDKQWYLNRYMDVREAGLDPVRHFILYGAKEGRQPNALFATKWYLSMHPEIAETGVNPLIHYIRFAFTEGHDPNPLFNSQWYLMKNPDVAESGINPLEHYLHLGFSEKRILLEADFPATLTLIKTEKIAVICHVYYPEMWTQLSICIRHIPVLYDLFVSIPSNVTDEQRQKIVSDFPAAHIKIVENTGGDIHPFLGFLEEIFQKGYTIFCKIHTKKGTTSYREIWKDVLLYSVLGSKEFVASILNAFDADDALAHVGSALLYKSAKTHCGSNRPYMEQIHDILYSEGELPDDFGFFAGTMFWGRTKVFIPLARAIQEHFSFENEKLEVDGQLAHAVERMFGAVVLKEKLKAGLVFNELGIMRSRHLQIVASDIMPSKDEVEETLMELIEQYKFAYSGYEKNP